jgi:hypothetical protein
MEEKFFHPFPGSLAYTVAVRHSVTQANIIHMGFIVFDDQRLHSFPTLLEVPS